MSPGAIRQHPSMNKSLVGALRKGDPLKIGAVRIVRKSLDR
jgi:hypothetical protein